MALGSWLLSLGALIVPDGRRPPTPGPSRSVGAWDLLWRLVVRCHPCRGAGYPHPPTTIKPCAPNHVFSFLLPLILLPLFFLSSLPSVFSSQSSAFFNSRHSFKAQDIQPCSFLSLEGRKKNQKCNHPFVIEFQRKPPSGPVKYQGE